MQVFGAPGFRGPIIGGGGGGILQAVGGGRGTKEKKGFGQGTWSEGIPCRGQAGGQGRDGRGNSLQPQKTSAGGGHCLANPTGPAPRGNMCAGGGEVRIHVVFEGAPGGGALGGATPKTGLGPSSSGIWRWEFGVFRRGAGRGGGVQGEEGGGGGPCPDCSGGNISRIGLFGGGCRVKERRLFLIRGLFGAGGRGGVGGRAPTSSFPNNLCAPAGDREVTGDFLTRGGEWAPPRSGIGKKRKGGPRAMEVGHRCGLGGAGTQR